VLTSECSASTFYGLPDQEKEKTLIQGKDSDTVKTADGTESSLLRRNNSDNHTATSVNYC
jgi:hypothetical protein